MKLTDKEFWEIYRRNAGLSTRTSRAIEREYGFSYSPQAVDERAKKNPAKKKQIENLNCDDAEDVLFGSFRSRNERIRLQAAMFYLKTKGKNRGYVERLEQTGKDGKELNTILQVEVIDRREQVNSEQK